MSNTDKILVGVVYRAPSSPSDNDCKMLTTLNDLQHYQPHSHLLLMYDFNLLNVDWVNNTVIVGTVNLLHNFLMSLKMHCSLSTYWNPCGIDLVINHQYSTLYSHHPTLIRFRVSSSCLLLVAVIISVCIGHLSAKRNPLDPPHLISLHIE